MTCPEERVVDWVGFVMFIVALESPDLFTFTVILAPPPQPNKQSPCDILDDPEIERGHDDDKDEGDNIGDDHPDEHISMCYRISTARVPLF